MKKKPTPKQRALLDKFEIVLPDLLSGQGYRRVINFLLRGNRTVGDSPAQRATIFKKAQAKWLGQEVIMDGLETRRGKVRHLMPKTGEEVINQIANDRNTPNPSPFWATIDTAGRTLSQVSLGRLTLINDRDDADVSRECKRHLQFCRICQGKMKRHGEINDHVRQANYYQCEDCGHSEHELQPAPKL